MARVDELAVEAYTVPTDAPEADGTLAWSDTTMVLVRVRAGGLEGIGWTYGPVACVQVVRDTLAGQVVGRDAFDIPAAWGSMVVATRNASRPGVVGYAISAVEIALWDLKARLLGLPLHRLLGAAREAVPVYGSGGFTTYDGPELAAQLDGWLTRGFDAVKIKVGESWGARPDRDLARIASIRKAIGPSRTLMVDANGGYGRKQAIRLGRAFEEYDVAWFEEPVSSDDIDGLAQIRAGVQADVTAGEYASGVYDARRLCAAGAVDCLQIDATRCGGLGEWLRASAVAASYGLDVSGHCAPHLHLAVAAAVPNLRHLEWFHDHVRLESMLFDGAVEASGGLVRPRDDEPGLGLRLEDAVAETYRVA